MSMPAAQAAGSCWWPTWINCLLWSRARTFPRASAAHHLGVETHGGVVHVADAKVARGVQLRLLCACHLLAGGGVDASQHSIAVLRVRLHTEALIPLCCWAPGAADLLPACCSFGLPQPRFDVALVITALQRCTAAADREVRKGSLATPDM